MTYVERSDNGSGWQAVCDKHGTCCDFDTRAEARDFAKTPAEWCGDCHNEQETP